jgi:hypothetical protein
MFIPVQVTWYRKVTPASHYMQNVVRVREETTMVANIIVLNQNKKSGVSIPTLESIEWQLLM